MEPADRVRFIEGVVERLAQVPGVAAAASGAYAPMTTMRATRRFAIDGEPLPAPGAEPLAIDLPAGPAYAAVMGLRLIDGRWISETDRLDSPPVVVISESFANRHFPGQRAVGRRLRYYGGRPSAPPPPSPEIVGVVSDVRQFGMAEAEAPQMYVPHAQRAWTFTSFFVRTASDPRAVFGSLPAAVHAVDPERPLEKMRTLDELVDASTSDRRALSALLVLAAMVALLISAIGVYGVTAATTASRKRELAIRAAIGADRRRLDEVGGPARHGGRPGGRHARDRRRPGRVQPARIGALRGRSTRSDHLRRGRDSPCWRCAPWRLIFLRDGHLPSAPPSP